MVDIPPYKPLKDLQKNHPEKKKLEALVNWLNDNNVDTSKLHILYSGEENRSMAASKNISKGDVVLHIPNELILHFDEAKQSAIG